MAAAVEDYWLYSSGILDCLYVEQSLKNKSTLWKIIILDSFFTFEMGSKTNQTPVRLRNECVTGLDVKLVS